MNVSRDMGTDGFYARTIEGLDCDDDPGYVSVTASPEEFDGLTEVEIQGVWGDRARVYLTPAQLDELVSVLTTARGHVAEGSDS